MYSKTASIRPTSWPSGGIFINPIKKYPISVEYVSVGQRKKVQGIYGLYMRKLPATSEAGGLPPIIDQVKKCPEDVSIKK